MSGAVGAGAGCGGCGRQERAGAGVRRGWVRVPGAGGCGWARVLAAIGVESSGVQTGGCIK